MRVWNERLVLTLLRRHGQLAKAEIARATGLSAQTVSVIMRKLEADGLITRGAPQRGRVGQPSVPMALRAEGAYLAGLKVGRRSTELVTTDFLGRIVARDRVEHPYPDRTATLDIAATALARQRGMLPAQARHRLAGLGVAMPYRIWDSAESLDAPVAAMAAWRAGDFAAELADRAGCPVLVANDASAACGAELVFGRHEGGTPGDFLYFHVGFFIGGGVVLGGSLYRGRGGNAGALGSIPVPQPGGGSVQLLDIASLHVLERRIAETGGPTRTLWSDPTQWDVTEAVLARWTEQAATGIAHAAVAAVAVTDIGSVVIDGWLPGPVRTRLVAATRAAFDAIDFARVSAPRIVAGTLGPDARVLGAASLPLADRFLVPGMLAA